MARPVLSRAAVRRLVLFGTTALVTLAPGAALAEPVSILTAAAFAAAGTAIGGGTVAAIAASAILGGIAAGVQQLLQPSIAKSAFSQKIPSQDATQPRRIVYGKARVAPDVPFSTSESNERWLRLVHVLAGHECDGLEEMWWDEELVWSAAEGFKPYLGQSFNVPTDVNFTFFPGTDDQQAAQKLVDISSQWTAAHRGRGVCWVLLELRGWDKLFKRGLPRVTYVVRGRKVLDPRTGVTAWSDNAALCINDWVLYNPFGYREKAKFWDEEALIAQANICDELVSLAAGGSEKRYTINGEFRADADKEDVLRALLTACIGKTPREGPRRRLLVGAWRPPEVELTDDDLVGPVRITRGKARSEQYEAVHGRFLSPAAGLLADDYPPAVSSGHDPATGEPRSFNFDQPFTASPSQAQRNAKMVLLTQAQKIGGTAQFNLKALRLRAGDTFTWSSERRGWASKEFEVTERRLIVEGEPPDMRVELAVQETGAALFDWTTDDETPYIAGIPTELPAPWDVDPPGLEIADELRLAGEQIMSVLLVTPSSSSTNVAGFEVQARRAGTVEPINLGRGPSGVFELPFVEDGASYESRGRTLSFTGAASEWTAWVAHTVVGKLAPPADVSGFRMEVIDGTAHLSWEPAPDLDLSHYRIRHSPLTSGATFAEAIDVAPKVARPATSVSLPWQSGTYLIVAVDKSGNRSVTPAMIVTTIAGLPGFNVVETLSDTPPFEGTHSSTEERDALLRLTRDEAAPFVADLADVSEVDDWSLVGLGAYAVEGFYELAGQIDLGAVFTSRLTATAEVSRLEDGTGIGGIADIGEVSDWGAIGGVDTTVGDVNVELQVSITEDDPAGAPTWSPWVAFRASDYKARAFRFRLRLTTVSANATPTVASVTFNIDMPDRVVSGQDIASGAGPFAVSISPAFRALKSVMITGQDMVSGDYWEITGKSQSGFTVTFRNAAGDPVSRVFDYQALGYGEAA